jgi:Ni/Co efflux regulator RcnB
VNAGNGDSRKEDVMNKKLSGTMAGLTALACITTAGPAEAQGRWRDRDRDGIPNQVDRHDNRGGQYRWHTYGGRYGYNGYRGRWREGQRFNNCNNSRYYINDWRSYDLPPPRRGYRYYRDDNGDIVMAAVGSGIIGLILGSQLGR